MRLPMRIVSYCLMPNHFHFVLWPHKDGDLSRWMQWLLTSHVRRYHRINGTDGRIWQGRFKAFPIQRDEHLLRVMRYVERNALRANLSSRAEEWPWCSLRRNCAKPQAEYLPVGLPKDWLEIVNRPESEEELAVLRRSVNRESPFGAESWKQSIADRLGLRSNLGSRGRPRC